MATHGVEGKQPELKTEWSRDAYIYVWQKVGLKQWNTMPGDTYLRLDGVLMRYGDPSEGWHRVPKCECGGEAASTTHSLWCPRSLK